MIKHFCDRCGKEAKDGKLARNAFGIKPMMHGDYYEDTISLCEDCQGDLVRWVKSAKGNLMEE